MGGTSNTPPLYFDAVPPPRAVPFTVKVWWDMKVEPDGDHSRFTCTISYDAPGWVDAAGTLVRNQHSVHEHLKETG